MNVKLTKYAKILQSGILAVSEKFYEKIVYNFKTMESAEAVLLNTGQLIQNSL